MESQTQPITQTPDEHKNIARRIIQVVVSILLMALILFVSAGTIHWPFAWILILISILVVIVNALIFPPELISERGKRKENVEKWDKWVTGIMIPIGIGVYLVAGLDHRLGWTESYATWIRLSGILFFILGNIMVSWAMVSNHYFSTAVRIQYDRGHQVAVTGPYQYVRHPGYLGMMIYHCFTPVLLGTLWALIPAFLTSLLFIVRTGMEDKTLKTKLDGYKDYAEKVKYRLVPGIW